MLEYIASLLPISYAELSAEHKLFLYSTLKPTALGFSDDAITVMSSYALQCNEAAITAIEEFNAAHKELKIEVKDNQLPVHLLTDCGEGDNYYTLRDTLMQLLIVAV